MIRVRGGQRHIGVRDIHVGHRGHRRRTVRRRIGLGGGIRRRIVGRGVIRRRGVVRRRRVIRRRRIVRRGRVIRRRAVAVGDHEGQPLEGDGDRVTAVPAGLHQGPVGIAVQLIPGIAPVVVLREVHGVVDLPVLQERHGDLGGAADAAAVVPHLQHPAHLHIAVQDLILGLGGDVVLPGAAGNGPGVRVERLLPGGEADDKGRGLVDGAVLRHGPVGVHQVEAHGEAGEGQPARAVRHARAVGGQEVQEDVALEGLGQGGPLGAVHVIQAHGVLGKITGEGEAHVRRDIGHAVEAHLHTGHAIIQAEGTQPGQIVDGRIGVRLGGGGGGSCRQLPQDQQQAQHHGRRPNEGSFQFHKDACLSSLHGAWSNECLDVRGTPGRRAQGAASVSSASSFRRQTSATETAAAAWARRRRGKPGWDRCAQRPR